jgi:hypothetical protein
LNPVNNRTQISLSSVVECRCLNTQPTTEKKQKGGRNNKMSSVRKLKHHTINLYVNSDFPCPYQHSIDCKSENESSKCIVYPASQTSNPHLLHPEVLVLAWGRSGGPRQARENREANLLNGGA